VSLVYQGYGACEAAYELVYEPRCDLACEVVNKVRCCEVVNKVR
jgi:hypothetical protein